MSEANKHKSRRHLLMVLGAFILPIVIAKLALTLNWLEYGVTNKGTLVENELTLNDIGVQDGQLENKWLILYALPNQCNNECEQTLVSVNNTLIALGREMPKVRNVALYQQSLSEQQLSQLDDTKWSFIPSANSHPIIENPTVLLVDPLGNIVLEHHLPESAEQQSAFGKGILADMKKLLKYSKIG